MILNQPIQSIQRLSARLTTALRAIFIAASMVLAGCSQDAIDEQHMLLQAQRYADQGQLVAAGIELRNILKANPQNAEARYLLGVVSLQAGDLAGAEKELRRALQAGWNLEQVKTALARIYIARQEYRKLLDEVSPDKNWQQQAIADATALRALAQAGLGETDEAISSLKQGKQQGADAPQVLRATAMFQMAGIEPGDARQTLDRALALYPDDMELLLLSASQALLSQQYPLAEKTYRQIIAREPPRLVTSHSRRARLGLARLLMIQQRFEEAQSVLQPVIRQHKRDPEANYLLALLAFNAGQYDRAEEHVRVLLEMAPDHNRSHQLLGRIKFALKDYQQAILHLSRYLENQPADAATRKLLAQTYLATRQPQLARQQLRAVLQANPDDRDALVLASQAELALGNARAGLRAIQRAIQAEPDNASLYRQLAISLIRAGRTQQALTAVQQFEQHGGDKLAADKIRVDAYLKSGQTDKAIALVNRLLAQTDSAELRNMLGSIYASLGDTAKATRQYQLALKQQADYAPALMGMAELAGREGDSRNLLKWLHQARKADSNHYQSRLVLARYYLRQGELDKAALYLKQALDIAPAEPDLLLEQGKLLIAQQNYDDAILTLNKLAAQGRETPPVQILLARANLLKGSLKKARTLLDSVLQQQPDNIAALSLLADLELLAGDANASLRLAAQLQKLAPESAIGYIQAGNARMRLKQFEQALAQYNRAWRFQQDPSLLLKRFNAAQRAGKADADAILQQWLAEHPDDARIRFQLGSHYQQAGRNQQAVQQFEALLKLAPENGSVLNNLAWLTALNNDPKAIDYAERAYRLLPEDAGVLDTYGWLLTRQGYAEKGLRLIEQALQILPDNPDIQYHHALALAENGLTVQARQVLRELLDKHPRFTSRAQAQALLQRLS